MYNHTKPLIPFHGREHGSINFSDVRDLPTVEFPWVVTSNGTETLHPNRPAVIWAQMEKVSFSETVRFNGTRPSSASAWIKKLKSIRRSKKANRQLYS